MHIVAAFFKAATTASAVYEQLNGVVDQALTPDGAGRYIMPADYEILAWTVLGLHTVNARVNTPSLRSLFLPEIYPVILASTPVAPTAPVFLHGRGPKVKMNEGLEVDVSSDSTGGTTAYGLCWIAPKLQPAAQGPVFSLAGTCTVTCVQGAWVLGSITLGQTLPAGGYQCVGMGVAGGDAVAARLVFPGQNQFRPGIIVQKVYGDQPLDDYFRYGRMGSFGNFMNTALPQIEILGDTAGSITFTVVLDLVKTG